jgi:hypothetical protein
MSRRAYPRHSEYSEISPTGMTILVVVIVSIVVCILGFVLMFSADLIPGNPAAYQNLRPPTP